VRANASNESNESSERNAIQAHECTVDLLRASFISVLIRSTSVKPAISRGALSIKLTDINAGITRCAFNRFRSLRLTVAINATHPDPDERIFTSRARERGRELAVADAVIRLAGGPASETLPPCGNVLSCASREEQIPPTP